MSLHDQMMNIPVQHADIVFITKYAELDAYKRGHRDARHAAAELSLEADAELAALRKRVAELEELVQP